VGAPNNEEKMQNSEIKKAEVKEVASIKEKTPVEVLSEYVSEDGKLKAVIRNNRSNSRNRSTPLYEVDFYKNNKMIATESYAFHTLRFHEEAAENYVNGIKKLNEGKVL
jgi:antitoxin component YwqK of YwqJK toxin-antitoxin module